MSRCDTGKLYFCLISKLKIFLPSVILGLIPSSETILFNLPGMWFASKSILKILTLDTKRHGVTFSYLATQSTNLKDADTQTFVVAIQFHPRVNFCCKKYLAIFPPYFQKTSRCDENQFFSLNVIHF